MRLPSTPRWTVPAAVAAAVATQVVALPALASADEPATWAPGEGFSTLYVLLVFVAGPIVLFVLIGALGLLGKHKTYPRPTLGGDQLEAPDQRFGEVGPADRSDDDDRADGERAGSTGGASASW
ncbi:MAG: hypothetical protein Q7T56_17710 [Nocardioidaceae bacterium]|nr:hypothetical protein [Nocardioidaceae bacterium]